LFNIAHRGQLDDDPDDSGRMVGHPAKRSDKKEATDGTITNEF
jgi:hypothetical protein